MADPVFTIVGEAGKAVDATPRTLQQLQAQDAMIAFTSLASGQMTWTIGLRDFTGTGALIPDLGQKITLLRDGERFFCGVVLGRDPSFDPNNFAIAITVVDIWWYLTQTPLSSDIADQTDTDAERTAYVLPTQDMVLSITEIIERMQFLGVPAAVGSMSPTFAFPRLAFANVAGSETLSELMRWLADGTMYVDYSGADNPAICMQRRDTMTTVELEQGVTIGLKAKLSSRLDLQVEDLAVFYARRDTLGAQRVAVFDSQTATTGISSGLPARQLITISGPEVAYDTLPQDFTDSTVVTSALFSSGTALIEYDERIKAAGDAPAFQAPATFHMIGGSDYIVPAVTERITDANGNAIPAGYSYYLTQGEIKDWFTTNNPVIDAIAAQVTATVFGYLRSDNPPPADWDPADPVWYQATGGTKFSGREIDPAGGSVWLTVWSTTLTGTVPLVKTHWATATTLIRDEDYAFVNPPAGFAAGLLATQNWLPYQGTAYYITPEIPLGHHVGKKLNISGLLPEYATMGALIVGHTIKLSTGENTLQIGSPDRLAFSALVSRFRQSSGSNIQFLSNPPVAG